MSSSRSPEPGASLPPPMTWWTASASGPAPGEIEGVAACGVEASAAADSLTRTKRMRSHDLVGAPSGVNCSSRSATAVTTPGMFHDFPQRKRTTGGGAPAASFARAEAQRARQELVLRANNVVYAGSRLAAASRAIAALRRQ